MKTCQCNFCKIHDKYKWAVVSECKCGCHTDGFTGHDGLCCSLPNVLKTNNPYKKLANASFYHKQLRKMEDEE